jgi:dienelactone hydrolase
LPTQAGQPEIYISVVRPQISVPLPTVIMLHGGAGLIPPQADAFKWWASWMRDRSVASVVVDSQRSRKQASQDIWGTPAYLQLLRDRAIDLQRTIAWLRATGWADAGRLLIFGESQGGGVALVGATEMALAVPQVVFYAPCAAIPPRGNPAYPRSLWLAGALDELAPAKDCVALRDNLIKMGTPASSIKAASIPGAYHAFDLPMSQPQTWLGKRAEFSAAARETSKAEVEQFMRQLGYIR